MHYNQSHYREVAQWEIFMGQELKFGLDLGRLAIRKKKIGADYEPLFRVFFSCFQGQKKIENIVASALKSCIEKR